MIPAIESETLNNINFQIVLKQHGGDFAQAQMAWNKILQLGRFGNVPHEYAGGLDLQSLRILADEKRQGQAQAVAMNIVSTSAHAGRGVEHMSVPLPDVDHDLEDRIKQIEDIASGDKPKD